MGQLIARVEISKTLIANKLHAETEDSARAEIEKVIFEQFGKLTRISSISFLAVPEDMPFAERVRLLSEQTSKKFYGC